MSALDRLARARCLLLTFCPFYGHIAMRMSWSPSDMNWRPEDRRTLGVRFLDSTRVECLFYPPFVERLTIAELCTVIQHEVEHVVRLHCIRGLGHQPEAFNVAADYCVNGQQHCPRIGFVPPGAKQPMIPFPDRLLWVPPDWPSAASAEYYYRRLLQTSPVERLGIGEGQGLDDHSVWDRSRVSREEARQLVSSFVREVIAANPGCVPGHLVEAVAALGRARVRWSDLLRQFVGRHLGHRRRTWSRVHRRHDAFGLPGWSRRAACSVNVILDTSGSVSSALLGQFFAEIDRIAHRATVAVLQWDHAFQGYSAYRPGNWRRWHVRGRGGTDMKAPFDWLVRQRRVADVQILLTDGLCYWPARQNFPLITVIAGRPGSVAGPGWGRVAYLLDPD